MRGGNLSNIGVKMKEVTNNELEVQSTIKTSTVSIRNMNSSAWHEIKLAAVKNGMTLAEFMDYISERLDIIFE